MLLVAWQLKEHKKKLTHKGKWNETQFTEAR